MSEGVFEDGWANLQLIEFNKDSIFKEALESLEKKKIEDFYFLTEKEPTEEDFDRWPKIWTDLEKITKKYVDKNKDKLFEYEFSKRYYTWHLSANIVIFYLLSKTEIEGDLKDYIEKRIIGDGYFMGPGVGEAYMMWRRTRIYGGGIIRLGTIPSSYLALKWFYNEKTKKYYSEELLEKIKKYKEEIKDSMDPEWRKRIDERGKGWKYRLRV